MIEQDIAVMEQQTRSENSAEDAASAQTVESHFMFLIQLADRKRLIAAVTGIAAVTATEPVEGDPESVELAVALSGGAVGSVSLARRHAPGETVRVEVLGSDGAASVAFVAPPTGDETIAVALRAQAEDFARAGGEGATVADAVAALDAAERARASL